MKRVLLVLTVAAVLVVAMAIPAFADKGFPGHFACDSEGCHVSSRGGLFIQEPDRYVSSGSVGRGGGRCVEEPGRYNPDTGELSWEDIEKHGSNPPCID